MMDELAAELVARPQDSTLYVRRTQLYLEHGEWQAALTDIERAERLGSDTAGLDLLRAQALALGGMNTQAEALLADFLQAHAEHGAAHLAHARVLLKMERFEEALKAYRTSLRRTTDPEPELYLEVGEALIAQKHRDEAIEVLELGIARRGNVPALVLKVMEQETAKGLFDAALVRMDVLAQQAPRPEPWMARRAALLQQAGRTAEARTGWTTLRTHILGLPNLERGSHAMSLILEETQLALAALAPTDPKTATTSP
ncbi:MAG: hypothetical protein B7Z37_10780 [Verrucomicrobia bacterium 12-59-8]|nr:MAG: hypothetical protein B7Z37_10780 [Verrucomicrobia bacterium 12-59-8]